MNTVKTTLTLAAAASLLAGCAAPPAQAPAADYQKRVADMFRATFRAEGIAKMDRVEQDLAQQACSGDKAPPADVARRIQAEAMAGVKWPAGGQYFGDFKEGEKLAQNGRGMTWIDKSDAASANGGNCYNCHQIDKKEISFGTIGPSLWNYGKTRGVTDVTAPSAAPIVQYTWSKLWNSRTHAACSTMPRFGAKGLLEEKQLRDLMSLLLDPKSPVNQ